MSKGALFFLIAAGLVSAFLFIFFGRKNWKKEEQEKRYDILVEFPFDLSNGRTSLSAISRLFFFLSMLSMALIPLPFLIEIRESLSSMVIFLMAILVFNAAASSGVMLISSVKTKPHLLSAILFFLFGGFCSFFAGLIAFRFREDYPAFGWIMAILFWLLCLLFILLAVNPKLSNWAKMKVVESVEGSYLEKPRPFWLAFSEWVCLILNGVMFVLLAITFIFIAFI